MLTGAGDSRGPFDRLRMNGRATFRGAVLPYPFSHSFVISSR
jgi:hypothetical protein